MTLAREIKLNKEIDSIRHEALLNIVRTASLIEKISGAFFGKFHITEAQYNILIVLKLEGRELTQIEIGERLVTSRANITSLIDRLEDKCFVKRKDVENDRRIYMIHLTEQGRRIVDKVEKAYVGKVEEIMSHLNESECKTISKSLEKLRESLRSVHI